ncbi:glycerophosphodiester phosphodiesterase [Microbacterium kyungheense]|uniref:Glycerophosphoryl diester phosphodiesterase n=1 Tax=Microbacterium kyungheense TaxID=1263636 RepID=A0A543FLH2_9MICO|nr:glycerophosphodiester phosphodiesterase family protein [Microbacterium kyungheense]TQM34713.1 glycerophosphoryl diester phosphodiesterase [Microbacterium kyungheense]
MPDSAVSDRARDRIHALSVMCVLAVASIVIAFLGATPARVSSRELLGAARTPGDAAFIASHRGGAASAPENTLPAIAAALDSGFDYVEVDVALTADRVPVLMHDATVDRTTDGHGRLAALTLAEVRRLDAGAWFDVAFAGTPVPTLTEFLDTLAGAQGRAIVELKGRWDAAALDAAIAEITARDLESRVVLASFDARTLALAASGSPVLSRLLILKQLPADVVSAVTEAGARGVVVSRKAVLARPGIVDELHAAGARVVVYTLNHDSQWDAVTALGVDGIVTDDPRTLSEWQSAYAGP